MILFEQKTTKKPDPFMKLGKPTTQDLNSSLLREAQEQWSSSDFAC